MTGGYEGGQAEYARVPFGALWPLCISCPAALCLALFCEHV